MAMTNRERVDKALDLLRQGLAPYVQREIQARSKRIPMETIRRYTEDPHLADKVIDQWDVSRLLKLMIDLWWKVFHPTLGHSGRNLAGELRDWRNKWAHQALFSNDDTDRALDSVQRLLTAVSAPQAKDVGKMKMELRQLALDGQARSESPQSKADGQRIPPKDIKARRDVIEPDADVAKGRRQRAEVAENPSAAHRGEAVAEDRGWTPSGAPEHKQRGGPARNSGWSSYRRANVLVADEVWIAAATLHSKHPHRTDFSIREITAQAEAADVTGQPLRSSIYIYVSWHCVANKPSYSAPYRMLYETSRGRRRLFRPDDPCHPDGTGKDVPARDALPAEYRGLIDWYYDEYLGRTTEFKADSRRIPPKDIKARRDVIEPDAGVAKGRRQRAEVAEGPSAAHRGEAVAEDRGWTPSGAPERKQRGGRARNSGWGSYRRANVLVADEVWIAAATLHRRHPHRTDFSIQEIMTQAEAADITGLPLRPGVMIHVNQHCVANRPPNPGRYRMLYETSRGRRRLFRPGDPRHPDRTGKDVPARDALPTEYRGLIDWYYDEYLGRVAK